MTNFPLRLRLTLWFLAIFATVFFGLTAAFWFIGRNSQRHILDEGLISLADGIGSLLVRFEGDMTDIDLRPYQPVDREFSLLAVRDTSGTVVAHDVRVEVEALPPIPEDSTTNTITAIDGEVARSLVGRPIATRMVTHRVESRRGVPHYIDVARTTDVGRRQKLFFFDVLFVAGIGGLISSTIAAWVLLGRATTPIQRLAEAARRVGPGETRLAVDPGGGEVETLRMELNDALERLDQGYRERQQFLANVAHDLKTPISVMLTQSQVMEPEGSSLDDFRTYRASMTEELLRLRGIIEGILTLSRAEQGEGMLRRKRIKIGELVSLCASRCQAPAAEAGVRIETRVAGGDEKLDGDVDLLTTMLDNILRNAIRFSPRGKPVIINAERSHASIVLSVRDYGPGIPAEYITKIFDRFIQVPNTSPHNRGTGLGLAIARAVCEAHGGSITVHNREQGCEFIMKLPLTT